MPVGAAMAGAKLAPANEKAKASRKKVALNIFGFLSDSPLPSRVLVAIGPSARRANGSTRSVYPGA